MKLSQYIWKENETEVFNEDRSRVVKKPIYKDGMPMKVFKEYPAKLLKNIDKNKRGDNKYKVGQRYVATMNINGSLCLMDGPMLCFKSNAILGTDFEWI